MDSAIATLVSSCARRAWPVVVAGLLLTALAGWFAATHFAMTADTSQLIAAKLDWRQHEIGFDAAFPTTVDTAVIVIDGATPELAETATAALTRALVADPARFRSVHRPDGGAFFDRYGLLLLPPSELQATANQLIEAQPLLAPLAADPSLRGVMTTLETAAQGDPARLRAPLDAFNTAIRTVLKRDDRHFSWRALVDGKPDPRTLRRFITLQPKLDFGAVEPGADSLAEIRATAQRLRFDAAHGVRVRLTGPVPLADEEFATLGERVVPITAAMLIAVIGLLWFALRSTGMIAAILVTTIAGLVMTAALGLVTVGRFNLISVAFIPLFVGLGIDFGIQFCVRFRAERLHERDAVRALTATGHALGGSLALAAAATAAGFFAFLPTDYVGVSELGVIAGAGMGVAFALSLTLLPALLIVLRPRAAGAEAGIAALGRFEHVVEARRRLILWAAGGVAVLCLALLPLLRFDFNPLHLRSPNVESMATVLDLMRDPANTPNTIDVLAADPQAAARLAERLSRLPDVAQAVTLTSFAPADQAANRAILADTAMLLDTVLTPVSVAPAPSDADTVASIAAAARALHGVALPEAKALATTLDQLAAAPPEARSRATAALIPGLDALLAQLRTALDPGPLTLAQLPPELVRDWRAADGRTRIELFPKANDNAALARFSDAVLAVAPDATGTPIGIRYSGRTIVAAFIHAGVLSLIAIAVLLYAVLRRVRDVLLTLAPILLSGLLTMATCVITGLSLNFANIIALPLMFGIGVAFHIYLIMAWRSGAAHLLGSSLARGVLFSALTTGIAFGALALSSHPGTASMGVLLMISLGWTLVAALVFKPALLAAVTASASLPSRRAS